MLVDMFAPVIEGFRIVFRIFGFFLQFYLILFPPILGYICWKLWIIYVRARYIFNEKKTLLEIKVPKTVAKSPSAMEIVLHALHQTGREATWYDRYFLGKIRMSFSLELVSIGGEIRFFIWVPEGAKNMVEAHIYAQYPDVEIYEVPDYTRYVEYDENKVSLWGCEFILSKPDYYPIKTYIDYGMHQEQSLDDEQRIDPLASVLEFMGSIGEKDQIWLQIVIRAHKKERRKKGTLFQTTDWREQARDEVKKLSKRDVTRKEGEMINLAEISLTPGERAVIEAIERSVSKFGFDCGIRGMYLSDKDTFLGENIPGVVGTFKQFGSNNLNSFRLNNPTDFPFPWQDPWGTRTEKKRREMFDAYRRRSFFYYPYKRKNCVLNTEELATIYHFPGGVAETPTFGRIVAKKSEPPTNLPL
jgi:hypothetical protein